MNTAPVFKETVAKVHNKKVAKEGFVFLIATAEVGDKRHTAYLQAPTVITAEERKVLFASLWNDLRPLVQDTAFEKPKRVKEHRMATKKIIAYAILAFIVVLILLSIFL